jgi:F420-0:gamma-glutamyl ligase
MLPQEFLYFEIEIDSYVPVTDNTELWLRVSDDYGTTFKAGVADYAWGTFRNTSASGAANDEDASDSEISLTGIAACGNLAAETYNATLWLLGAHQNSILFEVFHQASFNDSTPVQTMVNSSGAYLTLAKINAVRLLAESGNMSSGRIRLFGIR